MASHLISSHLMQSQAINNVTSWKVISPTFNIMQANPVVALIPFFKISDDTELLLHVTVLTQNSQGTLARIQEKILGLTRCLNNQFDPCCFRFQVSTSSVLSLKCFLNIFLFSLQNEVFQKSAAILCNFPRVQSFRILKLSPNTCYSTSGKFNKTSLKLAVCVCWKQNSVIFTMFSMHAVKSTVSSGTWWKTNQIQDLT